MPATCQRAARFRVAKENENKQAQRGWHESQLSALFRPSPTAALTHASVRPTTDTGVCAVPCSACDTCIYGCLSAYHVSAEHLFKGCSNRSAGDVATHAEPRSGASVRSSPASSGGVRSTRRPRPQSACPILCGQHLTRGNGHLCVGISSYAEEVRVGIVQPPQR
jgi:hypothetical protein